MLVHLDLFGRQLEEKLWPALLHRERVESKPFMQGGGQEDAGPCGFL